MKNKSLFKNLIVVILFFLTFWFGIRPIISGEEFDRRLAKLKQPKAKDQYSLVVCGTEPEGIAAALSGARMGLKTLLVTEDIDPGSYIKSSLITKTSPDYAVIDQKRTKLNGGIYTELFGDSGGNFSYTEYTNSIKQMLEEEKNLTVFYNAAFLSVEASDKTVESVTIYHNGETVSVKAPIFIDATQNGDVLSLCEVPYFLGSGDINVPDAYMPILFNFTISNVSWEDVKTITIHLQNIEDFQSVLSRYERVNPKTKIPNLSFIEQADDEIVVSGIRMRNINVDDAEMLQQAYYDALIEAKMLTAFLKTAFVPFEHCTFKAGASEFYIPEYRHFEGRYTLTVEDILENRDFPTKVVMAQGTIDAEKFVSANISEEYTYILGNPVVYSIPLECFISKNYDNMLMVGKKASFSSLAATSAGRGAVSITSGEAIGITAVYCYLNDLTPVELSQANEKTIHKYQELLRRSGIVLVDFDESNPNEDHWAWPSIKELVKYGLISGDTENDYLFDLEAYKENLVTLIENLVVKSAPAHYSLELNKRIHPLSTDELLTGEGAAEIILKALNIYYEPGQAYETAKAQDIIPQEVMQKIEPGKVVTMDSVYVITVYVVDELKTY